MINVRRVDRVTGEVLAHDSDKVNYVNSAASEVELGRGVVVVLV